MHARVVIGQVQPDRIDEVIRIYRESIVPAAKQQKGFREASLLADHITGKGMSIVVWETEADMIAGETSGYLREVLGKVAHAFAAPPVTEHYEVSILG